MRLMAPLRCFLLLSTLIAIKYIIRIRPENEKLTVSFAYLFQFVILLSFDAHQLRDMCAINYINKKKHDGLYISD